MSESQIDQNSDLGAENIPGGTPEQNIDADQVVVNNAPDGGGVDNEAPEPADDAPAEEAEPAEPTE